MLQNYCEKLRKMWQKLRKKLEKCCSYLMEICEIPKKEGEGILISIPMLKGCMSDGECISEAYENIKDAQREWITSMLERNMPIPEPDDDYSGKFVVRIPKSLHKLLVNQSKREGISLNQYVTNSLALIAGMKMI